MTAKKDSQRDSGGIDVAYVAHLARIHLTDEEAAAFQKQLGQVVDYVRQLEEVDVDGVEPMAHAVPVQNVLRKDETRKSLDHDVAMRQAPSERSGQFVVPRIVE
jgi:aspartyl-tRNA(Asn)/glutamyl-tRNA(Gln) amidotransferase subunit C